MTSNEKFIIVCREICTLFGSAWVDQKVTATVREAVGESLDSSYRLSLLGNLVLFELFTLEKSTRDDVTEALTIIYGDDCYSIWCDDAGGIYSVHVEIRL